MNFTNIVISEELAKALNAIISSNKTLFYYEIVRTEIKLVTDKLAVIKDKKTKFIPAYTEEELNNYLPDGTRCEKIGKEWMVRYGVIEVFNTRLVEAKGQLLLMLLDSGNTGIML